MSEIVWPAALLLATGLVCFTALTAWREWLAFRKSERAADRLPGEGEPAAARIELAAVRERLRRLEAIATGIDP